MAHSPAFIPLDQQRDLSFYIIISDIFCIDLSLLFSISLHIIHRGRILVQKLYNALGISLNSRLDPHLLQMLLRGLQRKPCLLLCLFPQLFLLFRLCDGHCFFFLIPAEKMIAQNSDAQNQRQSDHGPISPHLLSLLDGFLLSCQYHRRSPFPFLAYFYSIIIQLRTFQHVLRCPNSIYFLFFLFLF